MDAVSVYSDRLSGAKEARPGLNALMADARRGAFDVVVVWRFDRFARSVKQLVLALEEFRSLGIDFISHQEAFALDTSTPMGLEYARRHGTKSGKPIGRPRAVFRYDQVLQLRGEGLSGREIARRLGVGLGDGTPSLERPSTPPRGAPKLLSGDSMRAAKPPRPRQSRGLGKR